MLVMITRFGMLAVNPTAPLYPKVDGPFGPGPAPSLVAGSPGCSRGPEYTELKTYGNSVPGKPFLMSASPDNGPKENRYVWVPSPIVA